MKLKKLIGDIKKSIEANLEIGDACDVCRMGYVDNAHMFSETEIELGLNAPNCAGCGLNDCETLSEKLRTYKYGMWHTESWIDFAFNDAGYDLSPADYGFDGYYGDEITEEEEEKLNAALEAFCAEIEKKS